MRPPKINTLSRRFFSALAANDFDIVTPHRLHPVRHSQDTIGFFLSAKLNELLLARLASVLREVVRNGIQHVQSSAASWAGCGRLGYGTHGSLLIYRLNPIRRVNVLVVRNIRTRDATWVIIHKDGTSRKLTTAVGDRAPHRPS